MQDKKQEMTLDEFREKEAPGLLEIFDFTSNISISNYVDTTGVKIPENVYSGSILSRDHLLSETYLLNRKRNSMDLGITYGVVGYTRFGVRGSISMRRLAEEEICSKCQHIRLPEFSSIRMQLGTAIRARRSRRDMTGSEMGVQDLADILFYAAGPTGELTMASPEKDNLPVNTLGDEYVTFLKASPSGGGLCPIRLYMVLRNIKGLTDGIYYYLPHEHALVFEGHLGNDSGQQLNSVCSWGEAIKQENINVILFYVYNVYSNSRKYLDMALDFAMIEAGQISENIQLVCTAKGIASCDIGGFDKYLCEKLIHADGLNNNIVNATIIGR